MSTFSEGLNSNIETIKVKVETIELAVESKYHVTKVKQIASDK